MKPQLQITFRNMEPTGALEALVRRRAAWLSRFHPEIISCRVMVETPHRRRRQGQHYHVRIAMKVPGRELVVGRDPAQRGQYEEAGLAIRGVFLAARRALMDQARRRRLQVKAHTGPPHGRVTRLFPDDGYGFLVAEDGEEIYFHENSVPGGFRLLKVGDEVRYSAERGEKGTQASSVTRLGRGRRPAASRGQPPAGASSR